MRSRLMVRFHLRQLNCRGFPLDVLNYKGSPRIRRACNHTKLFSGLYLEAISNAPDCLNILRIGSIKFNLLTDLLNMNRNGGDITD